MALSDETAVAVVELVLCCTCCDVLAVGDAGVEWIPISIVIGGSALTSDIAGGAAGFRVGGGHGGSAVPSGGISRSRWGTEPFELLKRENSAFI